MSMRVSEIVRRAKIKGRKKLVLIGLANYADDNGAKCFPKIKTLAADLGCTTFTIQRGLAEVTEAGFVTREKRRRDDGGRSTDDYRLNLDAIAAAGLTSDPPHQSAGEGIQQSAGEAPQQNADQPPQQSAGDNEQSKELSLEPSGKSDSCRVKRPDVWDQPFAKEGRVAPWPDPLTGDQVRGLIERFGYRTKAGTTIGIIHLIRSASRANGDVSHRDELVEAGLLAVVDSDGNVAPDCDGDCFAITALGESTDVWPYPAGCILPDSDAIAALNEQYELDPFEDYGEQAALCGDQERTEQTEQHDSSDKWIIAMRDVVETCRRDGKMTVGDIVRGAETLGLVTGADDVLKAVSFGLLGYFTRDGMAITQAAPADRDLTA
jgi:hypothetical protein